jgi:AraC family transcriptional regulator of adaptative response/methylated-DNA-[protein]-cysteine methyltransferase
VSAAAGSFASPHTSMTRNVPLPPKDRRNAALGDPVLDDAGAWEAVCRRDATWDGRVLFGVLTTGVYCRPSCAARRPLRRNVRFYSDPEAARRDGLRACLRCRPDEPSGGVPPWVGELCALLERAPDTGEETTLAALGQRVGLSPAHLQRSFRAFVGVTPRQYAARKRDERLRSELRGGAGVTEALYAAGFGSSSRLHEHSIAHLGMTPSQYRRGGRGATITWATAETPVGTLLVAATDRGICSIQLGGSAEELQARLARELPEATLVPLGSPPPAAFTGWMAALRRHLAGSEPHLELPLDVRATAFQLRVWEFLRTIPSGETRNYGEVAAAIGRPGSARAVARACASNPVALAVPCHRVLRGDGDLGGYRWGAERKGRLLAAERAAAGASAAPAG